MTAPTEPSVTTGPLIDAIRTRLPNLRLLTDPIDRESYRSDETPYLHAGMPAAVALPTQRPRLRSSSGSPQSCTCPSCPAGLGAGCPAVAAGIEGGLTIAFTAMNRILEIDRENLVAVVQPGVINAHLKAAVARSASSTTRSGELTRCARSGAPRDERGRPVLRQVRPDARLRPLARGRDGGRHGDPHRRPQSQDVAATR